MDIVEISDRMELEKLVTDYATAVDTKNFQEFNNLFTQDAHIDYTAAGGIKGSLQEIIKYLETVLPLEELPREVRQYRSRAPPKQ